MNSGNDFSAELPNLTSIREDVWRRLVEAGLSVSPFAEPFTEWWDSSEFADVLEKLQKSYLSGSTSRGTQNRGHGYDDDRVRLAYMLFYYPLYVEPISKVLAEFENEFYGLLESASPLRVATLGAGPGPEIYGLLRLIYLLLKENVGRQVEDFSCELCSFDSHAEWTDAFKAVTLKLLFKEQPFWEDAFKDRNLRFFPSEATIPEASLPGKYHLVIFQNFLNEFYQSEEEQKLRLWLKQMCAENLAKNGLVVVIERGVRNKQINAYWAKFVRDLAEEVFAPLSRLSSERESELCYEIRKEYDAVSQTMVDKWRKLPTKTNRFFGLVYQKVAE